MCESVSLHPGQGGVGGEQEGWKDVGMEGYMYAHLHFFHPLFFPVLLLLVLCALYPPPLLLFYMWNVSVCVCLSTYMAARLRLGGVKNVCKRKRCFNFGADGSRRKGRHATAVSMVRNHVVNEKKEDKALGKSQRGAVRSAD